MANARKKHFWDDLEFRLAAMGVFFVAGLLLLGFRLYREQIRHAEDYRRGITRQSVRRIRIPARRGRIYSADLKLLAGNRSQRDLFLYPEEMRQPGALGNTLDYILRAAEELSRTLRRANPLNREKVLAHIRRSPGLPIELFQDLDDRDTARVFELASRFTGVGIEETVSRRYPQGATAAHVIGFTRSEDPGTAPDRREYFYYVPDTVGRFGLEKAFDTLPGEAESDVRGLRGEPGASLVQVDNLGFIRRTLEENFVPLHGNNLVLELELKAQKIAENLLEGRRGAMVLLDAESGAVIAMASAPSYNLAHCSPSLGREYYRKLLRDPARPMLGRAHMGQYTPGSIFKVPVALALLRSGVDPAQKIDCDGGTDVGTRRIRCASWRHGGHGEVDMVRALEKSCNDYFIEKGLATGIRQMLPVLASSGVGRAPGLEIGAAAGLLPSEAVKRRKLHAAWNSFDTALVSMGQGMVLLSPLQAALYTAAVANGGTVYQPRLVHAVVDNHGRVLREYPPRAAGKLLATPEALEVVRQGMFEVVNASQGSGRLARKAPIELRGKTGSAEIGSGENKRVNTWFICFGRSSDRLYALAVLLEDGASGGSTAAPVAAEFFTQYLKRR